MREGKLADRGADAAFFARATVEQTQVDGGASTVYARVTELFEGTGAPAGTLLALHFLRSGAGAPGSELRGALSAGDAIGLACAPGGSTLERSMGDASAKAAHACIRVARASGAAKVDELVAAKLALHAEMGRATCARAVLCGKGRRGDLARFATGVLGSAKATGADQQGVLELYDVTKSSFVEEAGCESVDEVLVPDKGADEINLAAVRAILATGVHPANEAARRTAFEKLYRLHSRMGEKVRPLLDKQDAALRKDARAAYDRMDARDKVAFSSLKRVL